MGGLEGGGNFGIGEGAKVGLHLRHRGQRAVESIAGRVVLDLTVGECPFQDRADPPPYAPRRFRLFGADRREHGQQSRWSTRSTGILPSIGSAWRARVAHQSSACSLLRHLGRLSACTVPAAGANVGVAPFLQNGVASSAIGRRLPAARSRAWTSDTAGKPRSRISR